MEFLKYSNIDLSEIIEEGLTRTIGKILSNISTKDIDEAFRSFKYKSELLNKIKEIEKKYKDSEVFKSILNDLKSVYAVDFQGYSILPKLNDKKELEAIYVYSVDKKAPRSRNFHVVWNSETKQNTETIVDKIEDIFFEYLDKDVTFKILGKPVKFNFNKDMYIYSINDIYDFDEFFQQELLDYSDEDYSDAFDDYLSQTFELIKKAANYTENSKFGKSVKCKFIINTNLQRRQMDIDFEFIYNNEKYTYGDIKYRQKFG